MGIIAMLLLAVSTRQRRVGVRRRVHGVRKFVVKEEAMLQQGLRHFVEEPFPFDDDDDDDDDRPSIRGEALAPKPRGNPSIRGEALAPEPRGNPSTWGTRGTPDADHLHGRLIGRDADGSQHLPVEPYRGAALDRAVKDYRDARCKAKDYGALPAASVIMVFYDEPLSTLLRSVASVMHRTPPKLLHEVVMVEDGGTGMFNSTGENLRGQLAVFGPKIVLLEMPRQTGLIYARAAGAKAATGDVLVFLDSHIETSPGWLEPLLAYARDTYRGFGIPIVPSIDADTFDYDLGHRIGTLGFSWGLGQVHLSRNVDKVEPTATPIMAGGLFAVMRSTFHELGDYDVSMRIYGGEETEISLRAWMYKVPGDEIHRNKLRAAMVWMDSPYSTTLVSKLFPRLPPSNPIGDLSERVALRKRIGVHDFQWYLKTVYPELKPPDFEDLRHFGAFRAAKGCLDNYASNPSHGPDLYPCHNEHGSQLFLLTGTGKLIFGDTLGQVDEKCVVVKEGAITMSEAKCSRGETHEWTYTPDRTLQHRSGMCLLALASTVASLGDCDAGLDARTWYIGAELAPRHKQKTHTTPQSGGAAAFAALARFFSSFALAAAAAKSRASQ
ncbi:polypeptide N-acetylgalactosaminyltransferase [Aureococcus anophagefferens]|nr:polypeptide N-acetylgalactosaminyltransferase [Aureococcus anophagefferens]